MSLGGRVHPPLSSKSSGKSLLSLGCIIEIALGTLRSAQIIISYRKAINYRRLSQICRMGNTLRVANGETGPKTSSNAQGGSDICGR